MLAKLANIIMLGMLGIMLGIMLGEGRGVGKKHIHNLNHKVPDYSERI